MYNRYTTDSSRNSPSRYTPDGQPPPVPQNGHQYSQRYSSNNSYTAHQSPAHTHHEDEDFEDETTYFEKNRIKQLQDERVHIQKKTFTKWCNSCLNKVSIGFGDKICFASEFVSLFAFRLVFKSMIFSQIFVTVFC